MAWAAITGLRVLTTLRIPVATVIICTVDPKVLDTFHSLDRWVTHTVNHTLTLPRGLLDPDI
jgi:hypothetical protein